MNPREVANLLAVTYPNLSPKQQRLAGEAVEVLSRAAATGIPLQALGAMGEAAVRFADNTKGTIPKGMGQDFLERVVMYAAEGDDAN